MDLLHGNEAVVAAVAGHMDLSHVPHCGGCNYTVVYAFTPADGGRRTQVHYTRRWPAWKCYCHT